MALDGIFLHHLTNELKSELIGAKVDKIYQPTTYEFIFHFRLKGESKKLLLCARADAPRLHITNIAMDNPQNPPMLTMLFRKKLNGAILRDIQQQEFDRVLWLTFLATNEIGDKEKLLLCVEIMGKHSNIILMNEEKVIIDAIKRVDYSTSSYRQILPNLTYKNVPKQNKFLPEKALIEDIISNIASSSRKISKAILDTIQGISPLIAREIIIRADLEDILASNLNDLEMNRLSETLILFFETTQDNNGIPTLYLNKERPEEFSYCSLIQYGNIFKEEIFLSYSQLLDFYYNERDRIQRTRQNAQDLFRLLSNTIERISKRINVQREELKKCENRETLRIFAELIQANIYQLGKGQNYYKVENYYENNNLTRIPVNPALSPIQNAQRYFKQYKKTFTAEKELTKQIKEGKDELLYIQSLQDLLERSEELQDILAIRNELISEGYLKRRKQNQKHRDKKLPPLTFISESGYTVFVGRNNKQNDELTLKKANKNDLWFHIKDAPGSHVILSLNNAKETEADVLQAATLAAWYSSARQSSKIPIDMTLIRHVHKPSGAKPGMVIYNHYSTLIVEPSQKFINKIKEQSTPKGKMK